jgi:hypothetical protein
VRAFNRIVLVVLGVALIGAGLLTIIEVIWTGTGSGFAWIPGGSWLSTFRSTAWSSRLVMAISAAVGALGLVLLLAEVRPWPKRLVRQPLDHPAEWQLLRRSTEGHLRRRLGSELPTSPIKVRLNPRALRWSLRLKARAARPAGPALKEAGQTELVRLSAPKASVVKVKTTRAPT